MTTEKKYIIFTDLKDFTYKNALLTDKQIETILSTFDSLVKSAAEKYDIKLIKSIGDAYFAVSETALGAHKFASHILTESQNYDATQKIDIKKISLRVTITYGSITQNRAMDLEDYFGEAINLGARIMDMTPGGQIFCTQEVQTELKDADSIKYIGNFSFHGILTEVPLYSLTPISDELIDSLKHSEDSRLKECEELVFRSSCVAAILSVQPLPFLENLNLVAIHLYMILKIAAKFNQSLSLKESSKIFSELIAPLGISYAAFQGSATMIKILLPGIGGYLFAPVSFGVSYALGKIYIMYFYYKASGEVMTPELIKELFSKHRQEGKRLAKERKKDIVEVGKKYSSEILHIKKQKDFTRVQKDTIHMLKKNKS